VSRTDLLRSDFRHPCQPFSGRIGSTYFPEDGFSEVLPLPLCFFPPSEGTVAKTFTFPPPTGTCVLPPHPYFFLRRIRIDEVFPLRKALPQIEGFYSFSARCSFCFRPGFAFSSPGKTLSRRRGFFSVGLTGFFFFSPVFRNTGLPRFPGFSRKRLSTVTVPFF